MVHLKLVKREIEVEKPASVEAWVISVKFKKGCYRHIQIPKTKTLAELADVILWSFDFEKAHAHAFFMDNLFGVMQILTFLALSVTMLKNVTRKMFIWIS